MKVPEGWSHDPSVRSHRRKLLPLALAGFLVSTYLTCVELGWVAHAWDPFFDADRVLRSPLSQALPVPDALLGALAYLLQSGLLLVGGDDRWHDRPRLTLLNGALGLALGAASSLLVFSQPAFVGTWCTLCLFSATISLVIAASVISETLAALQRLARGRVRPGDLDPADCAAAFRRRWPLPESPEAPWHLVACIPLGVATFALAALFGLHGVSAISINLAATLAVVSTILSLPEVSRPLRFGNAAAGGLLLCWFLGEATGPDRWLAALIGILLVHLGLHPGRVHRTYGIFSYRP